MIDPSQRGAADVPTLIAEWSSGSRVELCAMQPAALLDASWLARTSPVPASWCVIYGLRGAFHSFGCFLLLCGPLPFSSHLHVKPKLMHVLHHVILCYFLHSHTKLVIMIFPF